MFSQIVLASNNAGKGREFSELFSQKNIQLHLQSEFNVPECPEPYSTFIENALAKARNASKHSNLPALADDSGICFPALNGAPGVFSARFAGEPKSDSRNNAKISKLLINEPNKNCYYVCILVLIRHYNDPQPIITEGIWKGQWQIQAQGKNGFGYDPHFYLPEHQQTAAQLFSELKNRLSHRGQALAKLFEKLKDF